MKVISLHDCVVTRIRLGLAKDVRTLTCLLQVSYLLYVWVGKVKSHLSRIDLDDPQVQGARHLCIRVVLSRGADEVRSTRLGCLSRVQTELQVTAECRVDDEGSVGLSPVKSHSFFVDL